VGTVAASWAVERSGATPELTRETRVLPLTLEFGFKTAKKGWKELAE
jgi:hypothetical protein